MRQEAYDLVEAVRSLGVEITGVPGPKALRITNDAETFWSRLVVVKKALDAFDRAGGTAIDLEAPQPDEKYKKALDALLRLYQIGGGNIEAAYKVIQEALEIEPENASQQKREKRGKSYVTLPVFAPNGVKKKENYKPRINLIPEMPGSVDMAGLRRLGFDVSYVEAISGNTLASDPHQRNKMPPAPRQPRA